MSPALLLLLPAALAGELSGIVFDSSGQPLQGAAVTAPDSPDTTATTDSDGYFLLDLPAGEWTLRVDPQGAPAVTLAPLRVADDQVTEALITLDGDSAQVVAEQPASSVAQIAEDVVAGTLEGTVRDERGRPVAGARVFVRGQSAEASTDSAGRFALALPSGEHEISVLRSGYATRSVAEIAVPPGGVGSVEVELVESGVQMGALLVLMPRLQGGTATLLAERQDAAELVDTVSAEEMARRGDASAAAALTRVTGLTVVGGKYVYVRGLGERYSSTLLNGATLPSPEPERRVVPLDLFPTAMLDSVVIQKTFSPSMPAEFGGGVVRLRTRGVPDGPLFSLSVSGSYLNDTTFGEAFTTRDPGPTDFWGIDGGHRDLPASVADAVAEVPLAQRSTLPGSLGYTAEELEVFGEAMPNRWGLGRTTALPNLSASAVGGSGWRLGEDSRLGVLGGLTFSNGWQLKDYTDTTYGLDGESLKVVNSYAFQDAESTARLGGIFEVSGELGEDHSLRATTLVTRDTEASARQYQGYNQDIGSDIRVQRLRWVERQLLVQQLSGEHTFPGLANVGVDWRYSLSIADRGEPDRRDLLQQEDLDGDDGWRLRTQGGGNELFFSVLGDTNNDAGLDLTLPIGASADEEDAVGGELRVGGSVVRRVRIVDTRRFGYVLKGGTEGIEDNILGTPQEIFTEDSIDPSYFQFEEQTQATDNYTAEQEMEGVYVAAESRLPWRLHALAGVRREHSLQEVTTFQLFTTEPVEEVADLETADWLPALTLTRRLDDPDTEPRMQVRAGYGRTVSRPDFRELSPAVFNDVVGGREVAGNADLRRALIDNYDLRWEWYPSSDESLSIGAFYKHFTDPIESIVVVSAVSRISYANAESADNLGTEVEFRKSLGLGASPPSWLSDTYLSGNAAFIRSQVDLGDNAGNQTSDVRPLQGQSPYVYNLQLTYEGLDVPLAVAVLYNVSGPRITSVGDGGLPDTYEQPAHRLDGSASWRLSDAWRLKVSGRNLLNTPARFTVGDQTASEVRTGWSVGLGLSWTPVLDDG